MTLIVGTNTYISEADADEYITLMGLEPLLDAENSLKRATVAVDRIYGGRFIGKKRLSAQPLAWPRYVTDGRSNLYPSDFTAVGGAVLISPAGEGLDAFGETRDFTVTPAELGYATARMAVMIEAGQNVFAQPDPQVLEESVEVDVIKQSRKFAQTYRTNHLHTIALELSPLLKGTTQMRLHRG